MKNAHLIHGFNVFDNGDGTINKLSPYLDKDVDLKPTPFGYGWIGLMGAFFLNPYFVRKLIPKVKPGDIGIAHSNGCVILYMANVYGAPFSKLIFMSPALKSDLLIHDNIKSIAVMHTIHDNPVRFGKLLRHLIPWAPLGDALWGDMGAVGHVIKKKRQLINNSILDRFINILERNKFILVVSRVIIGFPIGCLYWLLIAPLEYTIFIYHNNIKSNNIENRISLKETEHKKYLIYAMIIPVLMISALLLYK